MLAGLGAGRPLAVVTTRTTIAGPGGLVTSINDMAKFDLDFHSSGKVWTPRVRDILLTPARLASGAYVGVETKHFHYAGGVMVGTAKGQDWVLHDGGTTGFNAEYIRLPKLKFSAAVFCNRNTDAADLAEKVIEVFRRKDLTSQKPGQPVYERWLAVPDTSKLDRAFAQEVAGEYYCDEMQTRVVLSVEKDKLVGQATSTYQPNAFPFPNGDIRRGPGDSLHVPAARASFVFERDAVGAISGYRLVTTRAAGMWFQRK